MSCPFVQISTAISFSLEGLAFGMRFLFFTKRPAVRHFTLDICVSELQLSLKSNHISNSSDMHTSVENMIESQRCAELYGKGHIILTALQGQCSTLKRHPNVILTFSGKCFN